MNMNCVFFLGGSTFLSPGCLSKLRMVFASRICQQRGEWEAPLIDNPKCTVGCGKWEAREQLRRGI